MKIENTTDFPDYFLRRMTSWCLKQHECPVRELKTATFRNRSGSTYSGRCYWWERRIVCSIPRNPVCGGLEFRINKLLRATAHETAHIMLYATGSRTRVSRRHGGRVSMGGSEHETCRHEGYVYNTFAERRNELIAAWMTPPARIARAAASVTNND